MSPGFDHSDPDAYTKTFNLVPKYYRDPYPFILPESPGNSQVGQIIIIIGGGDGIGTTAAKFWARAGAEDIVLVARRKDTLQKVHDEIKDLISTVKVLIIPADITNVAEVRDVFPNILKTFGRSADVLLQVAGYSAENEMIGETEPEEWWKSFVREAALAQWDVKLIDRRTLISEALMP